MVHHAELAAQLPLRSRPVIRLAGAASVGLASLLTPLALFAPPGRDEPVQLVLAGVLVLCTGATLFWWWSRAWFTLSCVDDQLVYRGLWGERRFAIDAVTGVQVTRWLRYNRPVSGRSVYLHYHEGNADRWVVIGAFHLSGAAVMMRAYRLANTLDVPIDDPEHARMRASWVPTTRWMGEGRDWLALTLTVGLLLPIFPALAGLWSWVLPALAIGAVLALGAYAIGRRPLAF